MVQTVVTVVTRFPSLQKRGFLRGQVALSPRALYAGQLGRETPWRHAGTGNTAGSRGSELRPGVCRDSKRGALARHHLDYRGICVRSTPFPPSETSRRFAVGTTACVPRTFAQSSARRARGLEWRGIPPPPPSPTIVNRPIVAAL